VQEIEEDNNQKDADDDSLNIPERSVLIAIGLTLTVLGAWLGVSQLSAQLSGEGGWRILCFGGIIMLIFGIMCLFTALTPESVEKKWQEQQKEQRLGGKKIG